MGKIPTLVYDGIKTLPLYMVVVRLKGNLPAFGSGTGEVQHPSRDDLYYDLPVVEIPNDRDRGPAAAIKALDIWEAHLRHYCLRSQFVDDENSQKYAALHRQTQLLSDYLEAEQSVDTTVLIECVQLVKSFADVHFAYRGDSKRDEHREEFERRLESIWPIYREKQSSAFLFVQRMKARLSGLVSREFEIQQSGITHVQQPIVETVDFVFVTALEEERDALLRHWPSAQPVAPSTDDVRFYYKGSISASFPDGSKCNYSAVLVPLLKMGRVSAALATSDAIRRWRPRYVILIGIAGGIGTRGVRLGDILISDQVVDYETQKIKDRGEPDIRWDVQLADPRLLAAAKNLKLLNVAKKLVTSRPQAGQLAKHVGPIATGDKIVAAVDLLGQHGQVWTKLIGIEMEAGGVASAAHESAYKPGFFMIRAVSDMADAKKNAPHVLSWRPYACDVAAAFAMALLESGPVPTR